MSEKLDSASTKVGEKMTAARETFAEKYEHFKHHVNPSTHIKENPWQWSFGALAAGLLAAPILKAMFTGKPIINRKRQPMRTEPEESAEYFARSEPSYAASSAFREKPPRESALQPIIDAFMPLAIEYARKALKLNSQPRGPDEPNEPQAARSEFSASISRRSAPPPRES